MERDDAIKFMRELLTAMVKKKSSDLFITEGFPPAIKLQGKVTPISETKLSADDTRTLTYAVMNDKQLREYEATKECNFAIAPRGIGRFRANAYIQQGFCGMVIRKIDVNVPTLEELNVPAVLQDIAMSKRGLVILVGGTGTGKSTTLAAMINYRNINSKGHIITIEDPIEYVHEHINCVITQREVGMDTDSWETALKNTLRQAPDVILIGEIRDHETMEHGITFAETGHLAMATLHANSANQALDRIINFFPEDRKDQLLLDLSSNIRAIVSQRLLKKAGTKNERVVAIEILINTPYVSDLILKGEVHKIKEQMARGKQEGMQTFDQALFELYEDGKIAYEDALRNADSMNQLRLRIKLEGKDAKDKDAMAGLDHLSITDKEEEVGGMLRR